MLILLQQRRSGLLWAAQRKKTKAQGSLLRCMRAPLLFGDCDRDSCSSRSRLWSHDTWSWHGLSLRSVTKPFYDMTMTRWPSSRLGTTTKRIFSDICTYPLCINQINFMLKWTLMEGNIDESSCLRRIWGSEKMWEIQGLLLGCSGIRIFPAAGPQEAYSMTPCYTRFCSGITESCPP